MIITRYRPPDHRYWHFLGERREDISTAAFFHMRQVRGIAIWHFLQMRQVQSIVSEITFTFFSLLLLFHVPSPRYCQCHYLQMCQVQGIVFFVTGVTFTFKCTNDQMQGAAITFLCKLLPSLSRCS